MKFKSLKIVWVACLLWIASWLVTPAALALTSIKLSDISYRECPSDVAEGIVSSNDGSLFSSCFLVTGKANNASGKIVVDADVFGRIYDANNNPVFRNSSRVGTIPEIPPGVSDFELRISVPENQPLPLQLKQFKASGFASRVRPFYYTD
ncbi:hypothetical protein IQ249_10685 [Lusitaniella coriacea LEGE 07157]|uniref:Biotin carboxylase n=1 Tax=Lusitaniella coriacea LEGE 07157 TaxID=945747 RepID=A0A8J7DWA9_9CYAN|nr:hypothetical protein [Lusitaniella coriacea]MBE9116364.1 hypothetical protein [Lusitaniella coriacea LEGE 07157]